ncbi:MAG: translation elongation factor 4 [SAR324 cluster bacterium]|nr:translation elongation factor 4 [SAR324 cluster bacterium]MCZ6748757.1 translation elongation factor 4 [SAR324 cluster bacterium]
MGVPSLPSSDRIRNFSIIAHIDHGKSTLADRLIEFTGGLSKREMAEQVLDTLELERERGITIKAQSVSLRYTARDGHCYQLNLIDTPGHVDFTYEVSRSLAACEGALLVVDAAQGVEAQTLANVYMALEQDLEIVPVLNKIDLPSADPDKTIEEIESLIGLEAHDAVRASAKLGLGIEEVLEQVVQRIPPPRGDAGGVLRALVYDAWFDSYVGVVAMVRVFDGTLKIGDRIRFMATETEFEVAGLGRFTPLRKEEKRLEVGEVGFLHAAIRVIQDAQVGDTITLAERPATEPLPGYTRIKPMVFSGLYPAEGEQFETLKDALEKLALNDTALSFEQETSAALGFGFRCGFLGSLHLEIVQERLEREYGIGLVTTAPTVVYEAHLNTGEVLRVENPNLLPDPTRIDHIAEPYVKGHIIVPAEYVGSIMRIALERRGKQTGMNYLDDRRVMLDYEFPLNEIVLDFYDSLKTVTRGYGSFDYDPIGYRKGDLVKLDVLLNGEPVDALSLIVPRDKAQLRGREIVQRLRKNIPRQLFEVAIQAAIGSKIVARETISALRKNVTAKCYGGDISRKRKLLEKQKEGKKRMKQIGTVEIPQEAFMAVVKLGD